MSCQRYEGDLCRIQTALLLDESHQETIDAELSSKFSTINSLTLSEPCIQVLRTFLCLSAYPSCYGDLPEKICVKTCNMAFAMCEDEFDALDSDTRSTLFPNDCAATYNQEWYPQNIQAWEGSSVFMDEFEFVVDSKTIRVPCENVLEEGFKDGIMTSDPPNKKEDCDFYKGTWNQNRCTLTSRVTCTMFKGNWMYDRNSKQYFCFFPNKEFKIAVFDQALKPPEYSLIDAKPTADGAYLLPVKVRVSSIATSQIAGTIASNVVPACQECLKIQDTCDLVCLPGLPPPKASYYSTSKVKVVPNDFTFDLSTPGTHILRLRTFLGDKYSEENTVFIDVKESSSVADEYLPDSNSNMVYIWFQINFAIDVENFDSEGFRFAMMELVKDQFKVELLYDDLNIIQLTAEGVKFELRIPSDQASLITARLKDPLFLYPVVNALYDNGILNSTDRCTAYGEVELDTTSLATFSPISRTAMMIGIAFGVVGFLSLASIFIFLKARQVKKKETAVNLREKDVASKQAVLEKREGELEQKLQHFQKERESLDEEKKKLKSENESLEKEEHELNIELDTVEHNELLALDPLTAEEFQAEIYSYESATMEESMNKLLGLHEKFEGKVPEDILKASLAEMKQHISSKLVFNKAPQRNPLAISGGSNVHALKSYAERLDDDTEKQSYLQLIDELVASGNLKIVAQDETERLRQEYDDAIFKLKSDTFQQREAQRERISKKRKHALELIVQDASTEPGDKSALETEVEEEFQKNLDIQVKELEVSREGVISKEEFEIAMEQLKSNTEKNRKDKIEKIRSRREVVKSKLSQQQSKLEEERKKVEARQKELGLRVSAMFQKISSVDTKVSKLKAQHEDAHQKLREEKQNERQRQREKLKLKKAATSKVTPAPEQ